MSNALFRTFRNSVWYESVKSKLYLASIKMATGRSDSIWTPAPAEPPINFRLNLSYTRRNTSSSEFPCFAIKGQTSSGLVWMYSPITMRDCHLQSLSVSSSSPLAREKYRWGGFVGNCPRILKRARSRESAFRDLTFLEISSTVQCLRSERAWFQMRLNSLRVLMILCAA